MHRFSNWDKGLFTPCPMKGRHLSESQHTVQADGIPCVRDICSGGHCSRRVHMRDRGLLLQVAILEELPRTAQPTGCMTRAAVERKSRRPIAPRDLTPMTL